MKALILFLFLLPLSCFGQRFVMQEGDTAIYPDGPNYPCNSFKKRDGRIINRYTEDCKRVGFWINEEEDGSSSEGHYNSSGKLTGVWKTYNNKRQLIREVEYASILDDTYTLKETVYKDGQPKVLSELPWFTAFYLKNLLPIVLVLGIAFFVRPFLNSPIHNQKNGTNFSPIYGFIGPSAAKSHTHSMLCTFTFWWNIKNLSAEHKTVGLLNNLFSIIALGGFLVLVIGLVLSGSLQV